MALTARTADTVASLIALAERFDAIASKKSSEHAVDMATGSATDAAAGSRMPTPATEPHAVAVDDTDREG